MEAQTKNGLIVTSVVALVVVVAYFGYKKFFTDAGNTDFGGLADNFSKAQTNLNVKPNKDNVIVVPFNIDGTTKTNKNVAQFYDNNRIYILTNTGGVVKKGNYSDGGKTISLEGGKTITSGSVYGNLLETLK